MENHTSALTVNPRVGTFIVANRNLKLSAFIQRGRDLQLAVARMEQRHPRRLGWLVGRQLHL